MDVITMSSKGQFVIPRGIREEMGLQQKDRFVVVHDKDEILLKRINEDEIKFRMIRMLDKFSDKFEKAGINKEDINKEIMKMRHGKNSIRHK